MRFDLVINLFIAKAVLGEKLTVFGGNQYRPFLHVQDAAAAFIRCLEQDASGVANIASDNLRIVEVAQKVGARLSAEVEVSQEITDERNYVASTDRMRQLGINPRKTIDDAIVEIKNAFDTDMIKDYTSNEYSNYKSLFLSQRLQRQVYSLGPIGERV
jgi:nucleoside-diphosphate-sugar epimerase